MVIKQKKSTKANIELPSNWKQSLPGWHGQSAPEITQEILDSKNVKEKISIWLDQDVLDRVREAAQKNGEKYQPLINRILRQAFLPEDGLSARTAEEFMVQVRALWAAVEELRKK